MKERKITALNALKHGDLLTRLSAVLMGIGIIGHGQLVKGLLVFLLEAAFVLYMINSGLSCLALLPSLGDREAEKVWNETKQVYEYTMGDNSQVILLENVITLFVIAGFIALWIVQMRHSYRLQLMKEQNEHVPSLPEEIKKLFDGNLHITLMTIPCIGVLIFNIIPLFYMISMAFTSYSKEDEHLMLFDWNGLTQFKRVLNLGGNIGKQFWSVLKWTIIWAIFATFLNYIFGMILAMIINRKETKWKGLWRFCFVLSIAVPQFVTLMIMNIMLQPSGAINVLLQNLGLISSPLPFWKDATWAKFTIIIINLWIGIPYTILQVTGILQNIPAELYEAARVDGAGPVRTFFSITLPYMLFVTTPYLITSFVGNINNFGVIYLLSAGGPTYVGDTAGQTDLLVTWLYKLTIDQQYYNLGAVIGIMTFIVLTAVTLITYRNSGSYRNEEAFM